MPTYEYICKACTHEFEVFHSIKADPISVCPKCKKKKVARKLGIGGAVIFKGGGFYETDYRSESYKQGETAANKPAEEKSATPAVADASSSAKPADAKTSSAPTNKEAPAATPTKPQVESKPTPTPESAPKKDSQGDSRATHPSRAGRGRGNIVQSAAKANAKQPSRAKKSR